MKSTTIFAIILLVAFAISAQEKRKSADWESASMDQWTSEQVRSILGRSAWAKLIEGDEAVTMLGPDPGGLRLNTLRAPNDTLILLRSSLLIKYALVRQRQLQEKYDSMKADAKKAFNAKNRELIECPACDKFYIVSIMGPYAILRDKKLITSNRKLVFLSNEKGEIRELANFSPAAAVGGEALFFFPRNDDKGRPLVDANNAKLVFNFNIISLATGSIFQKIEFNVPDLVREGKVIF